MKIATHVRPPHQTTPDVLMKSEEYQMTPDTAVPKVAEIMVKKMQDARN
jgi:hypothetical protein